MSVVTGVVEATSDKFEKFSILVNGVWYSSKYEIRANVGDKVQFEDMDKKYVRKLKVVEAGSGGGSGTSTPSTPRTPGFPVGVDTKDRSIVRQNSLAHSVRLISSMLDLDAVSSSIGTWAEREEITENFAKLAVDCARIFEDYSAGDSDSAEAAASLEE